MKNFFKDYFELARTNLKASGCFVKNHKIGTVVLMLVSGAIGAAAPIVQHKIEEHKFNKSLAKIEENAEEIIETEENTEIEVEAEEN